jgi:small subunit ribosomal protein S20
MPIIKSAKKRMKQTIVRRARNQSTKRDLRIEMKALVAAIEAKDGAKAAESLKKVQSNLDKTVKKNVLKKNTAARKMSRLTNQVKALGAKPAPAAKKKAAPKTAVAKPATKTATKKPAAKKAPAKKPVAKK